MTCYRNKTFCASDCKNIDCQDMLSHSVVCAAESAGLGICQTDLSKNCDRYQPPQDNETHKV